MQAIKKHKKVILLILILIAVAYFIFALVRSLERGF